MLKNTNELLEKCDENIAKVADKKNDYFETIIYLLDERGIIEEKNEALSPSYDKMLTFEKSSCTDRVLPIIACKRNGGRINSAIEIAVNNIYDKGGYEALDKFMEYIVTEAIPKFRAGIGIHNFEY